MSRGTRNMMIESPSATLTLSVEPGGAEEVVEGAVEIMEKVAEVGVETLKGVDGLSLKGVGALPSKKLGSVFVGGEEDEGARRPLV